MTLAHQLSRAYPGLNEPCCPDLSKRVCFECRRNIPARLSILAHNIVVATALHAAYVMGQDDLAGSVLA